MTPTKKLVVWRCPENHASMCGFLEPGESALRFCRNTVGRDADGTGILCNRQMTVVHDERPKTDSADLKSEDGKMLRIMAGCEQAMTRVRERTMSAAEIVTELGIALKGIKK